MSTGALLHAQCLFILTVLRLLAKGDMTSVAVELAHREIGGLWLVNDLLSCQPSVCLILF